MMRRSLTVVALAAFFPGCVAPTAPPDGPARYVLAALDGKPVPALIDSSSVEFGYIVADTIAFDGQGIVEHRFMIRRVRATPASDVTQPIAVVQRYQFGPGDRVEIGRFTPCGIAELCVRTKLMRAELIMVGETMRFSSMVIY